MRARRSRIAACCALFALAFSACSGGVTEGTIEVLERLPHDPEAYTQGLEMVEGVLYESTGKYGASDLRRVDPATGEVLERIALDEAYFGEGLTRAGDRILQLTWKERVAFAWPLDLSPPDTLEFPSDGWGACYDGATLWTTSGGSVITERDPATFATTGQIQARRDGRAVQQVNELECVGDFLYANVFQANDLLKIDKATGEVVAAWDLTALVPPEFAGAAEEVPNGIAHDPATDTYYLTGKWWDVMYRVRLVE
ncbi:MAG: glutaminyl-peptide cyclotransferase [Longimicrobiales bacterium]|nr:glutaminyl-peptide cyclotransferase [Longimicrobiales bacterium]